MDKSDHKEVTVVSDGRSSSDEDQDNIGHFYELACAVRTYNVKRISAIFQKSNNSILATIQDKNNKNYTLLHVAVANVKEKTDVKKVSDTIKCLMNNGVKADIKNENNETPLDLLQKISRKVTNFDWNAIIDVLQGDTVNQQNSELKLPEFGVNKSLSVNGISLGILPGKSIQNNCQSDFNNQGTTGLVSTKLSANAMGPEYYTITKTGTKRTLHGYIYQLKVLMLFVQRIPDGQKFKLATEMEEADGFDDVVLKYEENGVWKYRFVQAKHKQEEAYKIKEKDLFNIDGQQQRKKKTTPYLLKFYFDKFSKINRNFENVKCTLEEENVKCTLEEFLICTNINFSEEAACYFEPVENNIDIIFDNNLVVNFKLRDNKIEELKQKLEVTSENSKYFKDFIQQFRFMVNLSDIVLNELINDALVKDLGIKNISFAFTFMQNEILTWFESYKDGQSKFFKIEDKKEFLKSLKDIIGSLYIAGHSSFYIDKLKNYEIVFDSPFPVLEEIFHNSKRLLVLVAESPTLCTIKLYGIFKKRKFLLDEFIFVSSTDLTTHDEFMSTFCCDPFYKWLVIECDGETKIRKIMLEKVLNIDGNKKIIIIGKEDDVVDLNEETFYDLNNSFDNLDQASQIQVLNRQVTFQGEKVKLNQLLNINSAKRIIDDVTLENLLSNKIEIGDANELNSNQLVEKFYISRTIFEKYIDPHIFQNEEILKTSLFLVTGTNKNKLEELRIEPKWISLWEENTTFKTGIIVVPKNMIDDEKFFNLYQSQQNVYWIEHVDGHFFIKRVSEISDGVLMRPGIYLQEDNLCKEEMLDRKIMIIANDPGIGKSTYLGRVANELKKIMPNIWVLRINLSFYVSNNIGRKLLPENNQKSLEDISFMEYDSIAAIDFLADICDSMNSKGFKNNISRKLLIESLQGIEKHKSNYPKIVLLFDGFDEICPNFKHKTLTLLKALKTSNVAQMWITTRVNEVMSLETALETTALHLMLLSEKEKIDFFIKFWKSDKNNTFLPDMLERYAQQVLIDFKELPDFTDNPLHLRMLAEVILQKIMIPHNFGKWNKKSFLYKKFIDFKLNKIFREEKNAAGDSLASREIFENNLVYLKKSHQEIAFSILFPQQNDEFTKISNNANIERSGLLTNHMGRLRFVHRSFAEYFVCEYFAENLETQNIQNLVFHEVLSSDNHLLIRTFLNDNHQFLHKLCCKSPDMIATIRQTNYSLQLYKMVVEQNYNIFMSYLRELPSNVLERIVLLRFNEKKENILHWFCREIKNEELFVNLFDSIVNCVPDNALRELLTQINRNKKNIFHLVFNPFFDNLSFKKLIVTIDFVKSNYSSDFFHKLLLQADNLGNTVLHDACSMSLAEVVFYILKSVKDYPQVLNDMLLKITKNGQNTLHYIFTNKASDLRQKILILKNISSSIKESLNPKILHGLILHADNQGDTALHLACRMRSILVVPSLLELVKDAPAVLSELLLKTNHQGQTALHCMFSLDFINDYFVIERLKEKLKYTTVHLSSEFLHTLLLIVDKKGNTVLNLACMTCSNNCVTYLLETVKDFPEVSKSLLFAGQEERKNILHSLFAVTTQTNYIIIISILKEIINFITDHFISDLLYDLLLQVDYKGNTALHLACRARSNESVTILIEIVKENPRILRDLLQRTNKKKQNILHYIFSDRSYANPAYDRRAFTLNVFVDLITDPLNSEMLFDLLLQDDDKGNSLLHYACLASSFRCVDSLIEVIKDKNIYFMEFLFKTNKRGQNAMHCIFTTNSQCYNESDPMNSTITLFLDFLSRNFQPDVLHKMLLQEDHKGNTILHLACLKRTHQSVTSILKAVQDNPDVLTKIILKQNRKQQNALHAVFSRNDLFYNRYMDTLLTVQELVSFATPTTQECLLLQSDHEGNTASYCIANKVIQELLETVKAKNKIFDKLLLKGRGTELFETLKYKSGNITLIIQAILLLFKQLFGSEPLQKFLLKTTNREHTLLHLACKVRLNQTISDIIEAVVENQEALNKLALKTNVEGYTALHCTILIYDIDNLIMDDKRLTEDCTQKLLDTVKRYCTAETLQELLLATDNEGYTAVHMACHRISDEMAIYEQKQHFTKNDDKAALHAVSDFYGSNYFKCNHISRLHIILNFIKFNCPQLLIDIYLKLVESRTVLHIICNGIYHECEKEEKEWEDEWEEERTEQSIEEISTEKIKTEMLFYLLETIKDNTDLLNAIILTKDANGQTALHYTVYKFDTPAMLQVLFDFVKTNCTPETLVTLLVAPDDEGCTILHLACSGNEKILTYLINALEGTSAVELSDFLLKKDKSEHTAWNRATDNFGEHNLPKTFLDFWAKYTE